MNQEEESSETSKFPDHPLNRLRKAGPPIIYSVIAGIILIFLLWIILSIFGYADPNRLLTEYELPLGLVILLVVAGIILAAFFASLYWVYSLWFSSRYPNKWEKLMELINPSRKDKEELEALKEGLQEVKKETYRLGASLDKLGEKIMKIIPSGLSQQELDELMKELNLLEEQLRISKEDDKQITRQIIELQNIIEL